MPSYCIEVDFEFNIVCSDCGNNLDATEKLINGSTEYRVGPCEVCMSSSKDDGFKEGEELGWSEGWKEGKEEGYAEGHIKGYEDGQESVEDK